MFLINNHLPYIGHQIRLCYAFVFNMMAKIKSKIKKYMTYFHNKFLLSHFFFLISCLNINHLKPLSIFVTAVTLFKNDLERN